MTLTRSKPALIAATVTAIRCSRSKDGGAVTMTCSVFGSRGSARRVSRRWLATWVAVSLPSRVTNRATPSSPGSISKAWPSRNSATVLSNHLRPMMRLTEWRVLAGSMRRLASAAVPTRRWPRGR